MNTVLVATIAAATIAAITMLRAKAWSGRKIELPAAAGRIAALQTFLGAAVGSTLPVSIPGVAGAAAAAVSLAVVAVATDLRSRRIPKESCWVAACAGVVCFFTSGGAAAWGWFEIGASLLALGLVPLIAAMLTKGGLGFGDIRMLVAFALLLGWWVGAAVLMWGVITGCFVQGAVRVAARSTRSQSLPFGPALVVGITGWTVAALLMT